MKRRINRFTFAELDMIIEALESWNTAFSASELRTYRNALAKAKKRRDRS